MTFRSLYIILSFKKYILNFKSTPEIACSYKITTKDIILRFGLKYESVGQIKCVILLGLVPLNIYYYLSTKAVGPLSSVLFGFDKSATYNYQILTIKVYLYKLAF